MSLPGAERGEDADIPWLPAVTGSTRTLAAASGASFVGAVFSAVSGMLFIVVLGRVLGTTGAGVVLQAIGVFTIALGVAKLGLDTTAVWLLPRTRGDDPAVIRGVVRGLAGVGFVTGVLVAVAVAVAVPILLPTEGSAEVVHAVQAMAWFLPASVVTTVGLAATRGLGGIGPYTVIGNIVVPGLRPVLSLALGALGGGILAVATAWAAVLAAAAVPVAYVLFRQIRGIEVGERVQRPRPLDRPLVVRAARFSLPRALSSGIELAQQWLDVVVVGALAGPAAAGIYGAATRFIGAGMVPSTSMRLVVAPQFSSALHRGDRGQAQGVYRRTASWVVLLSTPIYVLLSLYGGTVLSVLGPGFAVGAPLLAVLSVGATVFFMTGNVQSVLLMSGRSGWVAANKAIVLVVLVVGLLALVPRVGVIGAAVAWSLATSVDALLASLQVSSRVGIRLEPRSILLALAVAGVPFLLTGGGLRLWLGDTAPALILGAMGGTLLLLPVCWWARRPLELEGVFRLLRRRGNG